MELEQDETKETAQNTKRGFRERDRPGVISANSKPVMRKERCWECYSWSVPCYNRWRLKSEMMIFTSIISLTAIV
jgi:hypothetical protein